MHRSENKIALTRVSGQLYSCDVLLSSNDNMSALLLP